MADALPAKQKARRAKAKVYTFVPRHRGPAVDHDTVRELELLLQHARLGRMRGLVWAADVAPGGRKADMACDAVGLAERDSVTGIWLARELLMKMIDNAAASLHIPDCGPRPANQGVTRG